MNRYIPAFITLIVYSIILLFIGRCTAPTPKTKQLQPIIEFTLPEVVKVPVPIPAEVIEIPVPVDVDTAAILQRYFSNNIYNRPIINTPNLTVSLVDTVYNNKLLGSTAVYKMVIPEYKHDISVGFLAGYNSFSVLGTYRYNRVSMSAGYDLMNKSLVFGVNYRLFKW